jgi:uncharacterized protein YeaO (DUF488 family)
VIAAATPPPVQDSAVATRHLRASKASPRLALSVRKSLFIAASSHRNVCAKLCRYSLGCKNFYAVVRIELNDKLAIGIYSFHILTIDKGLLMYDIRLARIYAPAQSEDGNRILTDRLWPRGKSKTELSLTEWYFAASPSPKLRRAWHKKEINEAGFAADYAAELTNNPNCLVPLMRYARKGVLTLLTASRHLDASHLPHLRKAVLKALQQEDNGADDNSPSSPTCYR